MRVLPLEPPHEPQTRPTIIVELWQRARMSVAVHRVHVNSATGATHGGILDSAAMAEAVQLANTPVMKALELANERHRRTQRILAQLGLVFLDRCELLEALRELGAERDALKFVERFCLPEYDRGPGMVRSQDRDQGW